MPILWAALFGLASQDPRPLEAFAPAHPVRIAATPKIDGAISDGEWDLFLDRSGSQAYMQWEPGTLYFGLRTSQGAELVVSLDSKGDGWLVGDDNLEIRVRKGLSGPEASIRRLDATDPAGPVWLPADVPDESLRAAVGEDGIEVAFTPRRDQAPKAGMRVGVRMDAVAPGADMGAAYLPRPVAFVRLETEAGEGLPPGFGWRPRLANRSVAAEDGLRVGFLLSREDESVQFDQVRSRLEGGDGAMNESTGPFPGWNRKGGAVYDFSSTIAQGTAPGYRVLRVELARAGAPPTVLRTSVRIAPLVDLEVEMPEALPFKEDAQVVRGRIVVRSNGTKRIDGLVEISVPAEWSVTKGNGSRYVIYHSRGEARVPFEIVVPRGEVGTGRIVVGSRVGERHTTREIFLPVGV